MKRPNGVTRSRGMTPYGVLIVCEIAVLLVSRHNSYYTSVALQWVTFALLAQGFNVIAGYGGRLAFGNVIFFGVAAYLVVAGTVHGWYPEIAGVVIAVLVCCALAYLLSLGLWRVNGLLFALATFALATMLQQLVTVFGTLGKSSGLQEPLATRGSLVHLTLSSEFAYLAVGAVLLVVVTFITSAFARSTLGREVAATREDRVAASTSGIDTRTVTALTWVLSAGITAVVGVFYAQYNIFVEPVSAFGLATITLIVVPAILGGLGTVWGPVLGSIIIPVGLLLNRLSSGHGVANLNLVVYGVILIVVLRIYPGGLIAALEAVGRLRPFRRATVPSQTPAASPTREERLAHVPELRPEAGEAGAQRTNDVLLRVDEVRKRFGGVDALQGVSFSVASGEVVGLLGPNGAGKSTMFNCIAGVETPDSGEIIFDGTVISRHSAHQRARAGIARTYQTIRLFPQLSALENVAVGIVRRSGHRSAAERAEAMLGAVGLSASPGAPAGGLSLVDQRRVEIARAMVSDARLVMLDEVMTGLDESEAEEMRTVVRDLNNRHATSFVIVEHVMGHILPLVSRVVIMEQGRVLADGDPEEVLSREDVMEAYFGKRAPRTVIDGA